MELLFVAVIIFIVLCLAESDRNRKPSKDEEYSGAQRRVDARNRNREKFWPGFLDVLHPTSAFMQEDKAVEARNEEDYTSGAEYFYSHDDVELFPLHGASAIKLILTSRAKVLGGRLGHSELIFQKAFREDPLCHGLSHCNSCEQETVALDGECIFCGHEAALEDCPFLDLAGFRCSETDRAKGRAYVEGSHCKQCICYSEATK